MSRPVVHLLLVAFTASLLVSVGLMLVGLPRIASAIPSHIAHSHAPAAVTWSVAPLGDPDLIAHQHRSAHDFDQDPIYDANKVWDNRDLRIDLVGAFGDGHGFIEDSTRPRFCIDTEVPANAELRIEAAFGQWSSIAADGGLLMGLDFQQVEPCPAGFIEIRVSWGLAAGDPDVLGYTETNEGQIGDCSYTAGFQPCRAWMKFNKFRPWDFGVDPAAVASTDYFFLPTALHEAGHVVGLADQADADDVMISNRGLGCTENGGDPGTGPCLITIDADSTDGARDLYSIPAPTPTPTPTPGPAVGGELQLPGLDDSALNRSESTSGSSSLPLAALVGGGAAAALALTATAGLYMRRRRAR